MDNQYREYLTSKKWEWYKKAIHYIYNNECYICGSTEKLHVHHKTYDRIYHEDLDDLVLVCDFCHVRIHSNKDYEKWFSDLLEKYTDESNSKWKDLFAMKF